MDYFASQKSKLLSEPYKHIKNINRDILFGEDIMNNPVPTETAALQSVFTLPLASGGAIGFDENTISRHLLLNGSSGCGKTNVLNYIIHGILQHVKTSDIVFIFDPKGDFKKEFYDPNNPTHILIGDNSINSHIWNVYDEFRDENGQFNEKSNSLAKELAKMFFVGRESSTQPFFSQAASNLNAKIFIDHIRQQNGLDNASFYHFVQTADPQSYLDMIARYPDFAGAKTYLGDINKKMSPQALGVLGYLTSMCDELFAPSIEKEYNAQPFSIRQLVFNRGGTIVFMEFDISHSETIAPLYQIWIDLAIKTALSMPDGHGSCYMILEEFSILPRILSMSSALNLGRSKGIKICAAIQSTYQLYQIYGEDAAQAILAGFGSYMGFLSKDPASRAYTSKRFGEVYENISFDAAGRPVNVQHTSHAVEDWEILKLKPGQAFCDMAGQQHPFCTQFKKWTEFA